MLPTIYRVYMARITIDIDETALSEAARELGTSNKVDTVNAALAFTDLPLLPEICERARGVQAELARHSHHRTAGVIDLLTAAAAEHYGASVVHYDRDFDHIAAVTHQPVRWVAPAGTLT